MPEVKRSKRLQNKKTKTSIEEFDHSKSVTFENTKQQSTNNVKESLNCFACRQKFAPIRRYKISEWIQCDQCDSWWHAECACMPIEDIVQLTFHDIEYTCAVCVLKGTPWILKNHNLSGIVPKEIKQESEPPSNIPSKYSNSSSEKQDCIVVVDKLQSPRKFKSSTDIRKEIKKFPEINPKLSYSLPKGGIALEFETKEQAEKAVKNWPSEAFGKESQCHRPRGKKEATVGFLKNIPNFVKIEEIKNTYSQFPVKSVRRLLYRNSQKPMPVVRIEFQSAEALHLAKSIEVDYSLNGKTAYLESEHSCKIVRCYNCHRFSHIGKACVYETRCGNCSKTDHTDRDCTYQSKCPNCEGFFKSLSCLSTSTPTPQK